MPESCNPNICNQVTEVNWGFGCGRATFFMFIIRWNCFQPPVIPNRIKKLLLMDGWMDMNFLWKKGVKQCGVGCLWWCFQTSCSLAVKCNFNISWGLSEFACSSYSYVDCPWVLKLPSTYQNHVHVRLISCSKFNVRLNMTVECLYVVNCKMLLMWRCIYVCFIGGAFCCYAGC